MIHGTKVLCVTDGSSTDEKDVPDEILQYQEVKLDLVHQCRIAIRKHLLHLDPHSHLFGRVPQLGLPTTLEEYMLFDQTLD